MRIIEVKEELDSSLSHSPGGRGQGGYPAPGHLTMDAGAKNNLKCYVRRPTGARG